MLARMNHSKHMTLRYIFQIKHMTASTRPMFDTNVHNCINPLMSQNQREMKQISYLSFQIQNPNFRFCYVNVNKEEIDGYCCTEMLL